MFLHHVYFYLRPDATDAARQQLLSDCHTMLRAIPGVEQLWAGPPAMTPHEVVDNAYAVALAVVFTDRAAHDLYQDHPTHLAFIERNRAAWERVRVCDFQG